jgi:histidyl-tRNA synthetase
MKKRMQKADAWGAAYALILGDDELARGEAAVKKLATGEQTMVAFERLTEVLR